MPLTKANALCTSLNGYCKIPDKGGESKVREKFSFLTTKYGKSIGDYEIPDINPIISFMIDIQILIVTSPMEGIQISKLSEI